MIRTHSHTDTRALRRAAQIVLSREWVSSIEPAAIRPMNRITDFGEVFHQLADSVGVNQPTLLRSGLVSASLVRGPQSSDPGRLAARSFEALRIQHRDPATAQFDDRSILQIGQHLVDGLTCCPTQAGQIVLGERDLVGAVQSP